jgi:hypothetical protein
MKRMISLLGFSLILVGCYTATDPEPFPQEQSAAVDPDCRTYMQFCVKVRVSGAVVASEVSGYDTRVSCAEWANGTAFQTIDLPDTKPLTVKDTLQIKGADISPYNGPGNYTLNTSRNAQGNLPSELPNISTGDRFFGEGIGSRATANIEASGSGWLKVENLVETKGTYSPREPDPRARLHLTMDWTCKDVE